MKKVKNCGNKQNAKNKTSDCSSSKSEKNCK